MVSRARHSLALHNGASAHKIRARKPGGRLKFYWPRVGSVVYFREVNHPGIGATPFLTSSMSDACRPLGFYTVIELDSGRTSEYL